MKNRLTLTAITFVGLTAISASGSAQPSASGDFNNDGVADLVVGVPDEMRQARLFDSGCFCLKTTNHPGAGAVNVVYSSGASTPLVAANSNVVSEDAFSMADDTHFGRALAAGKFRGPSFAADLAVLVPGTQKGGAIEIVFSASGKLNTTPSQVFFAQDFSGAGTALGANPLKFDADASLASGDFNGDQVADLAVEIVNGGVGHSTSNSAVLVFLGTAGSGFSKAKTTLLVVNDALAPDDLRTSCRGGRLCARVDGHVGLTAANLVGDAKDDLLIGATGVREVDDHGDNTDVVARNGVLIVPGQTSGLSPFSSWTLRKVQSTNGEFGAALAVGDFDADTLKDIAVGAPGDGSVRVFMGTGNSVLLRQSNSPNQLSETADRFGAALAAVDLDGNGASELAVGAPGEAEGNTAGLGAVTVFFGTVGGGLLSPNAARPTFTQPQLVGAFGVICCFANAGFGSSLTAANFGVGPQGDLVIGSPSFGILQTQGSQVLGVWPAAGSALTLYGAASAGFIVAPGFMQQWTQNTSFDVCPAGLCFKTGDAFAPGNHFGTTVR